ncbi:GCN5 family acetyltransferase [Bifidobacterium pseudolongum subsp. globosum]|uniref:GCN5 family acetyltransferase n=2 Tax=Bifidobacterium pseudolongum TaxID=1694 RepID=A0AB37X0G0_9BIFI|nr:GNAT family N-acetyltransferase [Bifidobacterium pseudolongum]RYQ00663.1 GCN5 family acetyltransferase [Bifidobacterium pseudolongum subsp. globosum]RYQ04417.1 GCN5 family acetyltransferase [Bifidobacterium pseudolongum subsp. globosum]RYQ05924.1 GCN5 family acetyltransferase [Bifidobacterium pseudolongum subsp. globosum]RYQ09477.1 GCN5 family acetyltransferase [Bifidobacterium pseudolongum subsp. globosum]RYQ12542.1 GCN5 family acetyltransferase [Bifidobacterium pseudolongum subsp. globosu
MIRIMTPDDYDAVHACWMACTCMGLNTIDDSREGIIRYLERNPNTCFVDEQEGTITGAILAGHDGRRGYIYHTAVNPAYRRQGIGTALVNAALHALANEGIIKVALVAFSRNDAGNAFWESLGFTARGDLTYRNKALCAITRIDT